MLGGNTEKAVPGERVPALCHKLWGLGQLPSQGLSVCICNMGTVSPVLLPHVMPWMPRETRSGRIERGYKGRLLFFEKDKAQSCSKSRGH